MYKLFAFYTEPSAEEKAAFEEYYHATHVPLCHKIPGLVSIEANKFTGALGGGPAPYYMITILTFNSKEEYEAGMATPEGKAVGRDTRNFPKGILSMAFAETVD
ncbi:MAG: EthD family reductase [Chloroflexi bacterium]|nr:EthD family reductase [Chloroflexota bacterium]OJV95277.1 MAG: hypothetical protein BGO39_25070 [Chloroflexi bacterium 54-19]